MTYDEFCTDVSMHVAALQKLVNELKCPKDADEKLFERSKDAAILQCMSFEKELQEEFSEYL